MGVAFLHGKIEDIPKEEEPIGISGIPGISGGSLSESLPIIEEVIEHPIENIEPIIEKPIEENLESLPTVSEDVQPIENVVEQNLEIDDKNFNNTMTENLEIQNENVTNDVPNIENNSESFTPQLGTYYRDDVPVVEDDVKVINKKSSIFSHSREKYAFIFFMVPIFIMSIVSMSHLVDFFKLGATPFISWLLGFAFESASLATIVGIVLLRKINKWALWLIWISLFALQVVGNCYSPFSIINPIEASKLFYFFGMNPSEINSLRIISIIQGLPLPTATFFLFKIGTSYLKIEEKQ